MNDTLIMVSSELAIENRPYTPQDIKAEQHTKDSTMLSKWETYYFSAKGMDIFPLIIKESIGGGLSMFRFWSNHCETLQEAKQHITSCLNTGEQL